MNDDVPENEVSLDTAGFQYAVRIALKDEATADQKKRIIACFDNYLGKADNISDVLKNSCLRAMNRSGIVWVRGCNLSETIWISSILSDTAGILNVTTWVRPMMLWMR